MRILITGGGCEELIDGVRSVCNFSTGHTASAIATALSQLLHEESSYITLLAGKHAEVPPENPRIRVKRFCTCADIAQLLSKECVTGYNIIIHAAAVSDYTPRTICVGGMEFPAGSMGKITSDADFTVTFTPNPKLLDFIKKQNTLPCFLVAFKLTNSVTVDAQREAVSGLYRRFSGNTERFAPDVVVANDKTRINDSIHECLCITPDGNETYCRTLDDLCSYLADITKKLMKDEK